MTTTVACNTCSLADVFGEGGLIARRKPGYEMRPEQLAVAEMVDLAIRTEENALIEAGTGVGKSFALVAPAVLSGKRTVVSTETLALLDQYIDKDLPFLAGALPRPFRYAKAKGKGNYACRRKLTELAGGQSPSMFADEDEVFALMEWAAQSPAGDRCEPGFAFAEASWQEVCCEEHCARRGCQFYGQGVKGPTDCFYYRARTEFLAAHVVVTNHTLLLLSAAIGGDAILGPHSICVIDEAHTLAEWAQKTFGTELKQRSLSGFARYVLSVTKKAGMALDVSLPVIEAAERALFDVFRRVPKQAAPFAELPAGIIDAATAKAGPLGSAIEDLRTELNRQNPNAKEDEELLEQLDDRARAHVKSLKTMFGEGEEPDDNWLGYVELDCKEGREPHVTLNFKPIDAAALLRTKLYAGRDSTVLASATLAVGSSFGFARRELGLEDPLVLQVGSPFDYPSQCWGYFPTHLPAPNSPTYHTEIADEVERILLRTNGRAFILFTAVADMRRVYELLCGRLKYDCMIQGSLPKPALVERFKADVHSCLFATRSFFAGVDIPGEALSCVILVKAPFRPFQEPLFDAKCKAIEAAGGNAFAQYSLPLMIQDTRQAFGRLIRNKTDRGLFAFLDSRANKAGYGARIRNALPPIRIRKEI